jgi:elongation factor P
MNEHHKPGKGQAVVRTRLKEVQTGKVVDRTFRAGEDVEQAIVERKTLQFLYREGTPTS